ncbi:DUF3313 domain-containing protein [Pantoea sp. Tr-811]|uniref:DUF3313 domain-containing protein n=1 Tax=unclassified Pantoea TaxID=2630326 RepID=UPI00141FEDFD|nr:MULTISPECIES: DUF3313 domain-containing protein [unclassified Pantoea]NIE77868.1 DUF3313 domain-containing protein [Pantoea sp. Ap-967]NIF30250.1 DUF3313 domain-containing protein [Pantoea sp. Tr-811]
MNSLPRITLLCAALLAVAACSSNRVDPKDYSGFLKDYSRLQAAKSPSGAPVMRWVEPGIKPEQYSQVYIEPSQFYPKPQPTAVISAQTLQQITRYFNEALRREMGSVLTLAKAPGPGTIVVRPAITAVSTHNEGLKPYEVIPIALIAAGVNTATGGRDQDVDVGVEAAFLDGGSQQVLAQVVRKGAGRPLENNTQQLTLDDVKPVLDGWARDMRASFEALKRKPK